MSPLHVAIVSRYARRGDGQGRANLEIASRALAEGLAVTLLADEVDSELLKSGARWIPVRPKVRGNDLAYGVESVLRATRALRGMAVRPDIVHGYGWTLEGRHDVNTAQFVHSAWRRHAMHPSRSNHGPYATYQWLYSALNAWGERRAFARARRVVGASSTIREELTRWGRVPADRVDVVLNGVDPDQFHPGAVDRSTLGLPANVPLALFAGDIRTGRKNLDTVLRGLARCPGIHLAVVGRLAGSPWPALAQALGIADRVHFLDFRSDIPDLMRAADCFVFPSRYEACALVLLEALASGLPVITAHTTGGAETVVDAAGIRLPDAEDDGALADALHAVFADSDRRRSMGEAARA
ncbi:MAG: glycosyltransferase family 4 protein, partial [Armatimonadota bacterium]